MRISARPEDDEFDAAAYRTDTEVFLDGVKLRRVVWADEEKGEAAVYSEGPDGRMIVQGDEFAMETRKGQVVIQMRPEDRRRILLERMARA